MNQEPKNTALPEAPGQIEQNPEEAAIRANEEAELRAEEAAALAAMPSYPREGSVGLVGEVCVVKFGMLNP